MTSRSVDYSGTSFSPAWRDFATLKTCRNEAEIPLRGAYLRQPWQSLNLVNKYDTINHGWIFVKFFQLFVGLQKILYTTGDAGVLA
jgi:hypothetical protein